MSLSQIAAELKQKALANIGKTQSRPLFGNAVINIRMNATSETEREWHLQIRREGTLPVVGSKSYDMWLRELTTFRRSDHFDVPETCEAKMQEGVKTYAAKMIWTETLMVVVQAPLLELELPTVAEPAPVVDEDSGAEYDAAEPASVPTARRTEYPQPNPLPRNAQEIRAWAESLGPGVRIRRVNVFTGEM